MKQSPTMNRYTNLTALLLTTAFLLSASEPSPAVKQAVLKAESNWKQAVLHKDRNTLDKLLAPDLSYTHSSAKTQTKEEFIQDATGTTDYKSIDFENTKLRQFGDTVVITHNAVIVTVPTGTSHLYLPEVWAKQEGHWQMVSRQAPKLP